MKISSILHIIRNLPGFMRISTGMLKMSLWILRNMVDLRMLISHSRWWIGVQFLCNKAKAIRAALVMREEVIAQACHVLSDSIMLLLSPQLHNCANRCQGATRAFCPNMYRGKHLLPATTRNTPHWHTHKQKHIFIHWHTLTCHHTSTDWHMVWLASPRSPNTDSYPL